MIPLFVPMSVWSAIAQGFDYLMQPLYTAVSAVLVACHWFVSRFMPTNSGWTWVLAIALLTLFVRSAVLPLYIRSLQSQRAMTSIQPKVVELQKKYGADRQKLSQEQMKLYKAEGVNPMASCWPMLLQMPIFFALFAVLNGAARQHPAGYFLRKDPELVKSMAEATVLGARFSGTFMSTIDKWGATQWLTLVLIIVMSAILFFQQREMMRKNMPPTALEGPMGMQQQKMMLYMFPAVYALGGISVPLGVLIYWCFSNIITFVQQEVFMRTYPTPNTPAYLDWQDRMRRMGKDPDAIERARAEKAKRKTVVAAKTTANATGVQRQAVVLGKGASKPVVQRQKVARQSSPEISEATAEVASDASSETTSTVGRQQPKRQTKSMRKRTR